MNASPHALERWAERFPSHDMADEYAKCRRLGISKRKRLIAFLKNSPMKRERPGKIIEKYYYLTSPCGAVFVMALPMTIVTVYPLPPALGPA